MISRRNAGFEFLSSISSIPTRRPLSCIPLPLRGIPLRGNKPKTAPSAQRKKEQLPVQSPPTGGRSRRLQGQTQRPRPVDETGSCVWRSAPVFASGHRPAPQKSAKRKRFFWAAGWDSMKNQGRERTAKSLPPQTPPPLFDQKKKSPFQRVSPDKDNPEITVQQHEGHCLCNRGNGFSIGEDTYWKTHLVDIN